MSARPWMPIYVGDYLRDTGHLSTAEHGAYFLLIMHYWMNNGLPTEDDRLSRIARMSKAEWMRAKPVLCAFFSVEWRHGRIDQELAKAEHLSAVRRASAKQKPSKKPPRATQSQSQYSEPRGSGAGALDPEREFFAKGKELLGKKAGGFLAKLLASQNRDTTKALACLEAARGKQDPGEYIGAIIKGNPNGNALKAACDNLVELAANSEADTDIAGRAHENFGRLLPGRQAQ